MALCKHGSNLGLREQGWNIWGDSDRRVSFAVGSQHPGMIQAGGSASRDTLHTSSSYGSV